MHLGLALVLGPLQAVHCDERVMLLPRKVRRGEHVAVTGGKHFRPGIPSPRRAFGEEDVFQDFSALLIASSRDILVRFWACPLAPGEPLRVAAACAFFTEFAVSTSAIRRAVSASILCWISVSRISGCR